MGGVGWAIAGGGCDEWARAWVVRRDGGGPVMVQVGWKAMGWVGLVEGGNGARDGEIGWV